MKILNLYACLGGNRYKWNEVKEDIEVTAVELDSEDCNSCRCTPIFIRPL
jgi:hypothetical protein